MVGEGLSDNGYLCRDLKEVKVTKGQVIQTSEGWSRWREHLSKYMKTAHFLEGAMYSAGPGYKIHPSPYAKPLPTTAAPGGVFA